MMRIALVILSCLPGASVLNVIINMKLTLGVILLVFSSRANSLKTQPISFAIPRMADFPVISCDKKTT